MRNFTVTDIDEIGEVTSPENIRANLVGIAVDYLTRFTTYGDSVSAFEISLHGAHLIQDETTALNLLRHLDGLTDDSIRAACQLDMTLSTVPTHPGTSQYKTLTQIRILSIIFEKWFKE